MLTQIKTYPITHMSLCSTNVKVVNGCRIDSTIFFRKILLGGAKLFTTLIEQALTYRLPVYNSFGMTETFSVSNSLTSNAQRTFRYCWKPSENVEVKIKIPTHMDMESY